MCLPLQIRLSAHMPMAQPGEPSTVWRAIRSFNLHCGCPMIRFPPTRGLGPHCVDPEELGLGAVDASRRGGNTACAATSEASFQDSPHV